MKYKLFDKRGSIWVDFKDHQGKRHRKPTGCLTEAEAEARVHGIIAETIAKASGPFLSPARSTSSNLEHVESLTFKEAFKKGMREREKWLTSKDKASIELTYKQVEGYWGKDTPLSRATKEKVLKWREDMMKEPGKRKGTTLAHSTINHRLSMLSVLLEIADLPPHNVKHLSVTNNRRKRRVREEEIQAVIKWMLAHAHRKGALLMADMILVGLHTTARMGELLNLKWADVYLDRGTAVLRNTKNGETREVVLTSVPFRILKELKETQEVGPFYGLNKWQAGALWREARAELGLAEDHEFVFHVATRHEGLSRLGEEGASAFQLKAYSGHRSIAAADRYVKPEVVSLRELGEKINRSPVSMVH